MKRLIAGKYNLTMKRTIFVLAAWAAVVCAAALAEGTPKIQFDKTEHDFGVVTEAGSVTGTFAFKNTGDAILKLDKPTTTCGCTVASVKPDILQPGEKGELTFTLTIPTYGGLLHKQIFVNSNDPQNPRFALSIKANHQPLYQVSPPTFNLMVRQGIETNVTVQVRRTDGKELQIAKVLANTPWITAQVEKPEATNPSLGRIVLKMKPEGSRRWFSDNVRIYAGATNNPVCSFWISGRIMGDVSWNPEILYWNINDPAQARAANLDAVLTKRVTVSTTLAGQPLEVHNAKSSLKEVSIELVPNEQAKNCLVVARLSEVPNQTVSGTLSFETNIPSQPRVEVPMTIAVLKR